MDRLGPFGVAPVLAAGVSGGADSLALLILANEWAAARRGSVVGVICDHGLRPGSAAEAASVACALRTRGLPVEVLALHVPVGTATPERARIARLGALEAFCAARGIVHLLLGHHAADQAETLMMRAIGGSGLTGLAGMAALRETAYLRVLRPLLAFGPDALRATCEAAGLTWVTDPANADRAYLRARLRSAAKQPAPLAALALAARAAGVARARSERAAAALLAAAADIRPEGYAIASRVDAAVCAALVGAIGGGLYPAPAAACERLAATAHGGTLGGVRLIRRGAQGVFVREADAIGPPLPAEPGVLWDGRFRVSRDVPDGATIGAWGDGSGKGSGGGWGGRAGGLSAAIRAAMPAIRRGGTVLDDPARTPWVVFAPPRSAAPAAFVTS